MKIIEIHWGPAASPLGAPLNNSSDFLPVREAFKLSLVSSDTQAVTLRFVAADDIWMSTAYQRRSEDSIAAIERIMFSKKQPMI